MKHLISIDDIGPDNRALLFKEADSLMHSTTTLRKDMEDKMFLLVIIGGVILLIFVVLRLPALPPFGWLPFAGCPGLSPLGFNPFPSSM